MLIRAFALLVGILVTIATAAVSPASAGTQLISARNPAFPRPAGGNGDSVAPYVTPDGNYVLFLSTANDLTLNGNNQLRTDLYLRSRPLGATLLVSPSISGVGGGNSDSYIGMVSSNGRYVAFASEASDLIPGDTNGATDVFLRDLQAGTTTLISVATNGGPGNGSSTSPFMTPDGRYVAFVSTATNLVANDTNRTPDVFVRDTLSGVTTLVSVGAGGSNIAGVTIMGSPVLTPDGRYVAFFGAVPGLPANSPPVAGDIYLRDLTTTNLTWISSNVTSIANFGGTPVASTHPVISDDGRYVAYKYGSTNLPGSGAFPSFMIRYDALVGSNVVINSHGFSPVPYYNDIYGPEMTPDGRYIAYVSGPNLHVYDNVSLTDTIVSQDQFGGTPTTGQSDSPVITPDGRYVAFMSTSTNLVANPIVPGYHAYVRDLVVGTNRLVDADTNGIGSLDITGTAPSLSTNGQFVAFAALDGSFVSGDFNHVRDVFLRDVTNGTTQLLSVRNPLVNDQSAGGISTFGSYPALAQAGRYVVYQSRAEDLVTNDSNGYQDVFEADMLTGTSALVSVGLDGNSAQGGDSLATFVSADGRYVAFLSAATNLVTNALNPGHFSLFRRDLQTGTTLALNVDTNGIVIGNTDCTPYQMSPDGRLISFICTTNATPASIISCLWNANTGITLPLATNTQTPHMLPYFSDDGRYVAYDVPHGPVSPFGETGFVWDTVLNKIINTNIFLSLSPTGTHALTLGGFGLSVFDFKTNVPVFPNINELASYPGYTTPGTLTLQIPLMWSTDGRFLATMFRNPVSTPAATDTNKASDVYLIDLGVSNVTLLSTNLTQHTANAQSDSVAISRDGRFVVYRSYATDVASGITNIPNVIVYDRFTGSNSLANVEPAGGNWLPYVQKPVLSGNGSALAFASIRQGLAPGTQVLNHQPNIYAQSISIWGTTDSDGDGIPDAWTQYYFGHPTGLAGDNSRAGDDADGDGMSNLQEFLAGTDPTNPVSLLVVNFTSVIVGNSVQLQWAAVPGVSYAVQFTDSLGNSPSWTTASGSPAIVGFQASFTAPASPAARYYRVVALPPP